MIYGLKRLMFVEPVTITEEYFIAVCYLITLKPYISWRLNKIFKKIFMLSAMVV